MNPIDDDILQAYVDGELDAPTAARIDAALVHDEVLADRVQQMRALRTQLQAMFDPVLDEPVPAHLSALLQPSVSAARRRPARRRWVPAVALAASLVLVALSVWWWRSDQGLTRMRNGQPYAAGVLALTLDQALASEPKAHAPVAIGLSFREADGHICRTFVVRTPPTLAGLACHGDAGWALPVLGAAAPSEEGELRQAASALPPEVQTAVDERLRGKVFDAKQERAARAAGWR
ncbi:anti-sigma factor family protein [Dyella flagellata]|uniref:Anti-sigma factor n=1 Tax=Dyella flagellata TaxID=1867833 RepID=A0ABQ5XCW4_9GAMM|nr:hypothetical protein [Dyella flagellata]GLQ88279.1 anti-sigma factor [Dyella flagellata]